VIEPKAGHALKAASGISQMSLQFVRIKAPLDLCSSSWQRHKEQSYFGDWY
jgi:hypothetical protein